MAKPKYKGEETCQAVEEMAREGLYNTQIAHNLGITERTFYIWLKKYVQLFQSLKKGRELSIQKVVNSTFLSAIGQTVKERKIIEYLGKGDDGKDIVLKRKREINEKYIPPNTTAAIFLMTNHLPDKYKHLRNVDVNARVEEIPFNLDDLPDDVLDKLVDLIDKAEGEPE